MTEIVLTIPTDMWLSANQRLHWAPKSTRTRWLRHHAFLSAKAKRIPPQGTTHVAAFIGYLRNGTADPSNAAPTVKALIDGLTDAGLWEDDDSTHVIGPTYLRDPKSSTPGHYTVRLVLTEQKEPWT